MAAQTIILAETVLEAHPSGALWWPERRLLCVSDLHFGKASRMARRGGALLPPYETAETLARLAREIARLAPAMVVCLGDSFDDADCARTLAPRESGDLTALMAGRDWIWIEGNHDPGPIAPGGTHLAELSLGRLTFRHEALPKAEPGEVSGHYHPKIRVPTASGCLTRSCFLADETRAILPAFGAYTGGLWCDHPDLARLMGPGGRAILTGSPCVALPLGAIRSRSRRRA